MKGKKVKVLIVDDALFMRKILAGIIEKAGYEVAAEATNGKEAVAFYRQYKPDVVTMDIVMPQKGGIEAVKEILAYDAEAKIVMVTAMGQQDMVVDAIQAGAKDFVVKPFEASRVIAAVDRLLH